MKAIMRIFLKSLCSILLLSLICCAVLASCNGKPVYTDKVYEENGLKLRLPENMRRSDIDGYDFYFSNLAIVFTAVKFDSQFLTDQGVSADIDAKGYAEAYVEKRQLDKKSIYYLEEPEYDRYSFRYTYTLEDGSDVFYYVVIIGTSGNLWYIEMTCDQENSGDYITEFEVWRKNMKTYS